MTGQNKTGLNKKYKNKKYRNKNSKPKSFPEPIVHTTVGSREPNKYRHSISIDEFIFYLKKASEEKQVENESLDGCFSASELAEKLKVSKNTIYRLLKKVSKNKILETNFVFRPRLDGLMAKIPVYRISHKNVKNK